MKHETFTVVYDGDALSGHMMDVRDLAPALLALSNIFDDANKLVYGDKADIKLHVKALEAGCFSVDLAIVQSLTSQMIDMLNGDWLQAALNLKELIVGGSAVGGGIFWLAKKLKGGKPEKITRLKEGMVRLEFQGEVMDVPLQLLSLYQDINVRKSVADVVSPLTKKGVDSISFKEGATPVETITKQQASYFSVPEIEEEELLRETRKAAFSIVSLAFKEDNKWRLHDGNNAIYATIKDVDFLRKVENNETSFRKSDVLICEVEDISTRDESGLKTEHNVIKVLDHKPAMHQIPLTISVPDNDAQED